MKEQKIDSMEWITVRGRGTTNEMIINVEKELGYKFPKDYIEAVLKYGSGSPFPYVLDIPDKKGLVFNRLFTFSEPVDGTCIMAYREIDDMSKGLVPIADDGFGNLYCYDFRYSMDNPVIVYWDHETAAIYQAFSSFTEMVNAVYDDDDDDDE